MPSKDLDARRNYQREWARNRRAKAVKLLGGVCVACGESSNLEFDHKDRTDKTYPIGHSWNRAWAIIEKELEKCQLLCYPCHVDKTVSEIDRNICRNGHDKNIYGRDTGNKCSECRREKDRRARREGRKK